MFWWWFGRVIFIHKPPAIYDTYCRMIGNRHWPDKTGVLQLGTLWNASQRHPEVAVGAEKCSQNRPPGTKAVTCQTADASTTLAAGSTQNWLQGVCVDIQGSVHICTTVPQPTHQLPRQRMNTMLDGYATAYPAICSYWHRCAAPSVWNSLPASVIESDSLSELKSRLKSFLLLRSFN